MPLPASLKELTRNKPAMVGLVGAVGVGLYVRHRNKTSGGASATTTAGDGTSGGSSALDTATGMGSGFPNTSGTDLATAVGNLDSQYAAQVAEFNAQLGTTQSALTALQGQVGALKPTPVSQPIAKPKPAPKRTPPHIKATPRTPPHIKATPRKAKPVHPQPVHSGHATTTHKAKTVHKAGTRHHTRSRSR